MASGAGLGQHLVEIRGMGGDDVERLVQIAVGGGDAQPGLDGQGAQIQPLAQPAQHQQYLGMHRGGPLPGTGTGKAADSGRSGRSPSSGRVRVRPRGHDGHASSRKRSGVFVETALTPGARPHIST